MSDPEHFKGRPLTIDKELEKFLKKIFRSEKENDSLFRSMYTNDSEFKEEFEESKKVINALAFNRYQFSEQEKEAVWNNIKNKQDGFTTQLNVGNRKKYPYYWAASIFIALVSIISIFFIVDYSSQYQVISTHFGETKKINLPDGSEVVLNANSILKYHKENVREVWIQGEAFFSVVHTKDSRPFQVKTMDDLSVLVLGTSFNVYNRENNVKVVLNTGKIQLQREGKNWLDMSPGELVEFNTLENYSITEVDPSLYTSWTNKKLIFKNTTVRELASLIEDTYGYEVIIPENNLKDQKISGTILNENLDGLLVAVSETLDLKVTKTHNKITLKSKVENKLK